MLEDFSFLGTDMHAHWLPGMDDGAKTMEESIQMIREMERLGYTDLIATPHIMADYYQNTPTTIRDRLNDVKMECVKQGITVRLSAAAEYLVDEGFERHLRDIGLLTLPGNDVLIEFGFFAAPVNAESAIFKLLAAGYGVILAHPERYPYYHRAPEKLKAITDRGVKLQVNLMSLAGHYGNRVKQAALDLFKSGSVDLLGTDAHRPDDVDILSSLLADRRANRLMASSEYYNKYIKLNS